MKLGLFTPGNLDDQSRVLTVEEYDKARARFWSSKRNPAQNLRRSLATKRFSVMQEAADECGDQNHTEVIESISPDAHLFSYKAVIENGGCFVTIVNDLTGRSLNIVIRSESSDKVMEIHRKLASLHESFPPGKRDIFKALEFLMKNTTYAHMRSRDGRNLIDRI